MSFNDLFWLFFVFTALQPVLRQRMLEAMRTRKIAQLERQRSSRVILLVHRREPMRLLVFPLMRYSDISDSEEVLRAIHMTDDDVPLDIVLHTPGGLVLAALQIARAIRGHKAKVTVLVPHYAMSGGTLIALAADEIVMSRHAVLGPIDPQLEQSPAASLLKVVEQKPIAEIDDKTLILADVGRKAIGQLKDAAKKLLVRRLSAEQAEALAEKVSAGTWTHDYPIAAEEARELGLPVSTEMPDRVLELMALYPQPVHTQPGGVEYLPVAAAEGTDAAAALAARWSSPDGAENGAEGGDQIRRGAVASFDRLYEIRTRHRPGPDPADLRHYRLGHLEIGDQDPIQFGPIGNIRPDRHAGVPKHIRHDLHGHHCARVQANPSARD